MLTLTTGLSQLRPHYTDETRELFGVLLNSTSAAEANLALHVLSDSVPETGARDSVQPSRGPEIAALLAVLDVC